MIWSWGSFAIGYAVGGFSAIIAFAIFAIGAHTDGVEARIPKRQSPRRDNVVHLPTILAEDDTAKLRTAD